MVQVRKDPTCLRGLEISGGFLDARCRKPPLVKVPAARSPEIGRCARSSCNVGKQLHTRRAVEASARYVLVTATIYRLMIMMCMGALVNVQNLFRIDGSLSSWSCF